MPTVAVLVLYTVHCYNAFPSTGREFFPPKTLSLAAVCALYSTVDDECDSMLLLFVYSNASFCRLSLLANGEMFPVV